MNAKSRSTLFRRRFVMAIAIVTPLSVLRAAPAAADHLQTPAELRDACERSPGNTVVLDHPTRIAISPSFATLHVNSGCTLVLGPNANLEVEASMIFAGPLDVRSTEKVHIKLTKSRFNAPSITFSLTGTGSGLALSESVLHAFGGSLLVILGDEVQDAGQRRSRRQPP